MSSDNRPLLIDDHLCFGCGSLNPIGLKLTFTWDSDRYQTQWLPDAVYQGWAGRVHGGMLALVLDETLSRAALDRYGLEWVTAELTTRLIRPATIGVPLTVTGEIELVRRSLIVTRGEVLETKSGNLVASGRAKLMRAKGYAYHD